MPRNKRSSRVAPGWPNHVVVRGNNRRRLFSYPRDYQRYLRYLAESFRTTRSELHQISMMGNHVHLIINPESVEDLSKLLGRTNQRYASVRNDERNASGKLFEERYWSEPITTTEQLAVTTAYNDSNFYRVRPDKGPVAHRWSTVRLHAGEPADPLIEDLWTPSAWYLSLGDDPEARTAAYREYLASYLETPVVPESVAEHPRLTDQQAYSRRLERPDRSRAREAVLLYRKKLRG